MSVPPTSVPQDHISAGQSGSAPSPPNTVPKLSHKSHGSSIPGPTANATVRPKNNATSEFRSDDESELRISIDATYEMYNRFNAMVDSLTALQNNMPTVLSESIARSVGDAVSKAIAPIATELIRSIHEQKQFQEAVVQTLKSRRRSDSDESSPPKKAKIDEAAVAEAARLATEAVRVEAERIEAIQKNERLLVVARRKAEIAAKNAALDLEEAQRIAKKKADLEAEEAALEI